MLTNKLILLSIDKFGTWHYCTYARLRPRRRSNVLRAVPKLSKLYLPLINFFLPLSNTSFRQKAHTFVIFLRDELLHLKPFLRSPAQKAHTFVIFLRDELFHLKPFLRSPARSSSSFFDLRGVWCGWSGTNTPRNGTLLLSRDMFLRQR